MPLRRIDLGPDLAALLFVLLAFVASLVSAVFGLGTALIVLSLGALILPVKQVVALSAVLFLASTLTKSIVYREAIPWRDALTVSLISLPFAWMGGMAMDALPAELLRRLLGAMVLGWLMLSYVRTRPLQSPPSWLVSVGAALYGFVSGLLGSGNLVKAILFRRMELAAEGFVGIMAATAVLANVGKLTAYWQNGLLSAADWPVAMGLVVAAVVAVFVGRHWLRRMTPGWFRNGLYAVMAVSALLLMI